MNTISLGTVLALLALSEIGRADPLDTWIWRNPLPTGNNLSAITYGNGRFVAVGWNGTTLTSAEGINWVERRRGTQDEISTRANRGDAYEADADQHQ